jgi:hypothetical protein
MQIESRDPANARNSSVAKQVATAIKTLPLDEVRTLACWTLSV